MALAIGDVILVRYRGGPQYAHQEVIIVGVDSNNPNIAATVDSDKEEDVEEYSVGAANIAELTPSAGLGYRPLTFPARARIDHFAPLPSVGECENWIRNASLRFNQRVPVGPIYVKVEVNRPDRAVDIACFVGPQITRPGVLLPLTGPVVGGTTVVVPGPVAGVSGVLALPAPPRRSCGDRRRRPRGSVGGR